MAAPLERDRPVRHVIGIPPFLRRGLNRAEDAVRRDRGGVTRPPRETGDIVGLHVHEVHVGRARADIFSGYVAAA